MSSCHVKYCIHSIIKTFLSVATDYRPLQKKKKRLGTWCQEYKKYNLEWISMTDISSHMDKMQFLNPHSSLSVLEFFWSLHSSQSQGFVCSLCSIFVFAPFMIFQKFWIGIQFYNKYCCHCKLLLQNLYDFFSPTEILEITCNILAWYLPVSDQDTVSDYEELCIQGFELQSTSQLQEPLYLPCVREGRVKIVFLFVDFYVNLVCWTCGILVLYTPGKN
jgi:hypothetical protein